MKVFDLHCASGHAFEGWFASEEDFFQQRQSGLLTCPLCGAGEIERRPSAPRLNLGASPPGREAGAAPAGQGDEQAADAPAALQAAYLQLVRKVMAHTEDVGPRFAQEARRMHHGETPERHIRGQSTPQETRELLEEGIAVLPLPIPPGFDGPLH